MEYPKIQRENIDFINDTEVCNLGYYEMTLSDKRPLRIEKWLSHEVENVTIFMSIIGFEEKSEDEIKTC